MSKTYTPELTPDVLQRLEGYAAHFRDDFRFERPARWAGVYLAGLIQEGERKSIEPLASRVVLPPELQVQDPEQVLQQFVNQSPWDEQQVLKRYRAVMAQTCADPQGIFVIDDTSFPKQGKHSVGVQRQYCGALGKKANCQVAPSVHYVSPKGHYPLAMRLYPSFRTSRDEFLRISGTTQSIMRSCLTPFPLKSADACRGGNSPASEGRRSARFKRQPVEH